VGVTVSGSTTEEAGGVERVLLKRLVAVWVVLLKRLVAVWVVLLKRLVAVWGVLLNRVPQKGLLLVLVAVWEVLVGGVMHFFFIKVCLDPSTCVLGIVILLEVVFIRHHAM